MNIAKRVDVLEEVTFGGKNPQDSLVSLVHNNNNLTIELLRIVKSVKKWIVMSLIATISTVFYIGYKAAQFDMVVIKISDLGVRVQQLENSNK